MIEQKAIYEAAQTAFASECPKFPFPKKHNLEEQTDEFKRAFLHLSTEINAMHKRELEEQLTDADRQHDQALHDAKIEARNIEAKYYCGFIDERDRKIQSLRNKNVFAWLIIGILVGGAIIYFMNQPADCIEATDLAPGQPYMNFEGAKVAFEGEKGSMKAVHICE